MRSASLIAIGSLFVCACHSGSSDDPSDPDADRDGIHASNDCNDNDAATWQATALFADADTDGIGAGSAIASCVGNSTPAGFSTVSTDCAASDPAAHTLMSYAARDADGDMVARALEGAVCGDGHTLPSRHFAIATNDPGDCDDQFATVWQLASFHEDFDRDGVGHGPLVAVCSGNGPPPAFAISSTDCEPLDATKWRMVASYLDVDGDGVGSGSIVPLCVGTGPAPYGSSFLGFDPLDTLSDPSSTLVSDFDLNVPSLFIESESDDDDDDDHF